jgi:hypothetical protein
MIEAPVQAPLEDQEESTDSSFFRDSTGVEILSFKPEDLAATVQRLGALAAQYGWKKISQRVIMETSETVVTFPVD